MLEEVIAENADNILQAIELDEFLRDPEAYLLLLGDAFLKEHIEEIEEASKEVAKQYVRSTQLELDLEITHER